MKPLLGICILVAFAIVPSLATDDGTPIITIGTDNGLVYTAGETVLFSGTNTAGETTYLFVTGPELPESGVSPRDFSIPAETGNRSTFMEVPVTADSYTAAWDPAGAAPGGIPDGSYTFYASAAPVSFSDLAGTPCASVTIFLVGWPSAVPLPTASAPVTIPPTQAPVTIPPTQEPFPFPTASDPGIPIPPPQTPVPVPTVPAPTDPQIPIPPTQEPFPFPTASDPGIPLPPTQTPVPVPTVPAPTGPPGPLPPTHEPFPFPTASDPSGTPITIPPTVTPIPLPTPPVPFPLPSAPSAWQLPNTPDGFDSWSDWFLDQLIGFLLP